MKKFTSNNTVLYLLGIVLFLAVWEILSIIIGEETMVLPSPFSTISYAIYLLGRSYTWECIGMSSIRMVEGFVLSLLIAFVLGVIAGYYPTVYKLFQPAMVFLRSVPTACLIYLFIVLAGIKDAPLYLVMLVALPILYEGIATGIRNVSKDVIESAKVEGANFFKENLLIRLPLAKPYIVSALLSSFSLSFKIEIMAEVITGGSNAGLGCVIQGVRAYNPTDLLPVFGYSLIAVMMMLIIDFVISLLKKEKAYN